MHLTMKLLFYLILLANLTLYSQAAVSMGVYNNENFPGKCYISRNLILDQGVSIKDPMHKCRQIVCGLNGSIVFQSCGAVGGLEPSCTFGDYINVELPYPDCCERVVICKTKLSMR